MPLSNEELIQKAFTGFQLSDLGGGSGGLTYVGTGAEAPLSLQQADRFIQLMTAGQVMLPIVKRVSSKAAKWQEAYIEFAAGIARTNNMGTAYAAEGERQAEAARSKPTTGLLEMSTILVKAEVPVSDEVMEDNIENKAFGETVVRLIADRFGFDIEDLMLNGDTAKTATDYLAALDGWVKQAKGTGGNVTNAATDGQDYQTIFRKLLLSLPVRWQRGLESSGAYFVPLRLEQKYRDILSSRGTPLGDLTLQGTGELRYQGIPIKGVHTLEVTAGTPDTSHVLLAHNQNLYAGFHRDVTMETWRDPREGATSFIVTCRIDAKVAVRQATAVASNVDIEP